MMVSQNMSSRIK